MNPHSSHNSEAAVKDIQININGTVDNIIRGRKDLTSIEVGQLLNVPMSCLKTGLVFQLEDLKRDYLESYQQLCQQALPYLRGLPAAGLLDEELAAGQNAYAFAISALSETAFKQKNKAMGRACEVLDIMFCFGLSVYNLKFEDKAIKPGDGELQVELNRVTCEEFSALADGASLSAAAILEDRGWHPLASTTGDDSRKQLVVKEFLGLFFTEWLEDMEETCQL